MEREEKIRITEQITGFYGRKRFGVALAKEGYNVSLLDVLGFKIIAQDIFQGDLDKTLEHLTNPEIQGQNAKNIQDARESHRWLTDHSIGL